MESAMESEGEDLVEDWEYDVDEEGAMGLTDWEELNSNRWYNEIPTITFPHSNRDGVESIGGTPLDQWQESLRNVRREIDIGGKTLQEVEAAAGRIKEGEVFTCFKEFDFCVDCWCVMNMRSSVKFKTKSIMRVRVCIYGLLVRKKGVGKITKWSGESSSRYIASTDLPHVLGVRSYKDFSRRLQNPSQPMLRPDRPDLNLHSQEFSQSTPRRKRNRCPRGECGEQPRYEAAAMVRTAFEDSEDEEGSDAEDEGQECGKGPSKKPPNQANKYGSGLVSVLDIRFNLILEEAGNRLDCGREFVQYIRRIDPERFVRYALPLPRYGRIASNSVECMNGALKPIRDFAPCRIAGQMWMYMLRLFCERREKANRSTERFTTFAKERLSEEEKECGRQSGHNRSKCPLTAILRDPELRHDMTPDV
ncbi:hypothetical protein R1sor_014240 [Riccia sorocarpa]|uniref:Transposase n=1 Tax=Riccia sorocarpa TaxID=122646 RepID=A0ABD3HAS8_9MARC